MKNIAAFTKPGMHYPGFISINEQLDGSVTINVRADPPNCEGVLVEGKQVQLSMTAKEWTEFRTDVAAELIEDSHGIAHVNLHAAAPSPTDP